MIERFLEGFGFVLLFIGVTYKPFARSRQNPFSGGKNDIKQLLNFKICLFSITNYLQFEWFFTIEGKNYNSETKSYKILKMSLLMNSLPPTLSLGCLWYTRNGTTFHFHSDWSIWIGSRANMTTWLFRARLNGCSILGQHHPILLGTACCLHLNTMLGHVGRLLDEVWFLSNISSNIGQHFSSSMRIWEYSLVLSLSAYAIVTHSHHFTICDRVFQH